MNQVGHKQQYFSTFICALIIPCLVTPLLASIYPWIESKFQWQMMMAFAVIDFGLIVATLIIVKFTKFFDWRILLLTYLYMLALFICNVFLAVYVWSSHDPRSIASIAIASFVRAGLMEEAFKLACWLPWIYVGKRHVNLVAYVAALSGLLFAFIENMHMMGVVSLTIEESEVPELVGNSVFVTIAYIRFLWMPIFHLALAMVGYSLFAILRARNAYWIWYIFVLMVPSALHGLYDFGIFLGADMGWTLCTQITPLVSISITLFSIGLLVHTTN